METPPGPLRRWTLGGIKRGTDKNVLGPHSSATLIPIVQQYVRRGMTIYTGLWRAYDFLDQYGYVHGTVNHSQNFVNPVHMNSIEGTWTHAKKLKPQHK